MNKDLKKYLDYKPSNNQPLSPEQLAKNRLKAKELTKLYPLKDKKPIEYEPGAEG